MWRDQLRALAPDFTAAAWDCRGYGDSEDYDGALNFADFAADLAVVLDTLGVRCAHIVGQSMGARIALDFYRRWPERVATLTLANTSAASSEVSSPERVEQFLQLRKKPLLEGKSPRDIAPQVAESLVGPGTDAATRARLVEILAGLHTQSYLKTLDAVTRYNDFPPFEEILVPTLVIGAEHDRIATPVYARQIASRVPHAECCIVEGGSHVSNMDRPDAFNRALLPFLQANKELASIPSRAQLKAAPEPAVSRRV